MPPLRVQRFNDNGRHPNPLISFIKEDKRSSPSDQKRALAVLSRVAAIVYPIMKANGLQVTSLEEQPYNNLWAGMNWNAGECIQLVLRTAHGGWVPDSFVVSVMLHELSHCTNMHHAGPFWRTLGQYRAEMAKLKERGYTGEGFWSRGITLNGESNTASIDTTELPRNVCGGAGSRRRVTRHKPKKIKLGEKLGGDVALRARLDGGKSRATPRVVKSKRGRELRASAAEIRFSSQVTESLEDVEEEWEGKADKYDDEGDATKGLLDDEYKELRQSLLPYKPVKREIIELIDE